MYTRLKCAGQTQDAILKEHHVLPTWKAMNSNRKRERGRNCQRCCHAH